ncbi:hypothetical protein F444_15395, partial [Phytophthora nicotianae P1976]
GAEESDENTLLRCSETGIRLAHAQHLNAFDELSTSAIRAKKHHQGRDRLGIKKAPRKRGHPKKKTAFKKLPSRERCQHQGIAFSSPICAVTGSARCIAQQ